MIIASSEWLYYKKSPRGVRFWKSTTTSVQRSALLVNSFFLSSSSLFVFVTVRGKERIALQEINKEGKETQRCLLLCDAHRWFSRGQRLSGSEATRSRVSGALSSAYRHTPGERTLWIGAWRTKRGGEERVFQLWKNKTKSIGSSASSSKKKI